MRNKLIERVIHLYGFENLITIEFAKLCSNLPDTSWCNKMLEEKVKDYEYDPLSFLEELDAENNYYF